MLTLRVEVPEGRDRTASASLHDSLKTLATGPAVASALSSYAADHANPQCDPLRPGGHPPIGRYRLIHHEPAPAGQSEYYGTHVLVFEPQSGPALEAESFGRLGLLVFGGPPSRRTQGGLRIGNELLKTIVARIAEDKEIALNVVAFRPRAWWQFWKSPDPASQALSGLLNPPQPPYDELSLLEALLQKAPARPRGTGGNNDYDPDRHRSTRDSTREPYDRSNSDDRFQGGGGQSGGGGASGSWDSSSGRGPGVDNTGRIVGAAVAVGAVAAAAAAMASHGRDGDSGGGSGGGGGSDAFSGASADTSTSTSY